MVDSDGDTTRLVSPDEDGSGDTYEVECVVTDSTGKADTATASASESEPVEVGDVEQWGMLELTFTGPSVNNPYQQVDFSATFNHNSGETRSVAGFWDGGDTYRLRFMPEFTGDWSYQTSSSHSSLDGMSGSFTASTPTGPNRGPVTIDPANQFHFIYEDGTQHYPVGTTCYGMAQVDEAKRQITLDMLGSYGSHNGTLPFNKVRTSALPHNPTCGVGGGFNNCSPEPAFPNGNADRINPAWFKMADQNVEDLLDREIQVDFIMHHSFAEPNPGEISSSQRHKLFRYLVARYGGYRNIWWDLSNEYDKTNVNESEWRSLGQTVRDADFYDGRLASIHATSGTQSSLWGDSWCDHVASQFDVSGTKTNPPKLRDTRSTYGKAGIVEEYGYEGDQSAPFEVSAKDAARGQWKMTLSGFYATHGETWDQEFFRGGGQMHASSTERVAFFRDILLQSPAGGLDPIPGDLDGSHIGEDYYLFYYDDEPPTSASYDMPGGKTYAVDVIDTWGMTIDSRGKFSGSFSIPLPGDPYIAVRMERV